MDVIVFEGKDKKRCCAHIIGNCKAKGVMRADFKGFTGLSSCWYSCSRALEDPGKQLWDFNYTLI